MKPPNDLTVQWRHRLNRLDAPDLSWHEQVQARVLRFLVSRYAQAPAAPVAHPPSWISPAIIDEQLLEADSVERQILDEERLEARIERELVPLRCHATLQELARVNDEARAVAETERTCAATRGWESAFYQVVQARRRVAQAREEQREQRRRRLERVAALRVWRR